MKKRLIEVLKRLLAAIWIVLCLTFIIPAIVYIITGLGPVDIYLELIDNEP